MAELARLGNGIPVAIDPMAGAQSAAIGLHAFVGSRSEPEGKGGLAHLVEHMVFKGARGRDARAIAEAIGRTNDCILYGGQARYTVRADDATLESLAAHLPAADVLVMAAAPATRLSMPMEMCA